MPQPGEQRVRKDGLAVATWNGSVWVEAPVTAKFAQGQKPAGMPALTPQDQLALREARDSAAQASEMSDQASRFVELNRQASTGPVYGIPFVGPALSTAMSAFKPELAQMNALESRMVPQQRVPGSGTTSDRDLALYQQSVPSVKRMGTANAEIARDISATAEKRKARSAYFDAYAKRTGSLNGAQVAFDQWWTQYDGQRKQKASGGAGGYKILSVE